MKTYNLGNFGVPSTVAPKISPSNSIVSAINGVNANAGPRTVNSSLYGVSQNYNANQPRNVGHASTHGINPDIIANSGKSEWEMDDDTRDFLTDAFNTLNQEEEAYGSGGGSSGGGGGGGLGGQFSGGPGTQHGTTWSFGKRPAFKPQGIF